MKITKTGKQLISLALTMCLIVVCLPMGITAAVSMGNDVISFSDDVVYNGSPQVLAKINAPEGGVALDSTLIEITYEGTMNNGNPYPQTKQPPTDSGTYRVTFEYEGDDNYESYLRTQEIRIKQIELQLSDFITRKPVTKEYDGTVAVLPDTVEGLTNSGILAEDKDKVIFDYSTAEFMSKDVNFIDLNKVKLTDVTVSENNGDNYLLLTAPDMENIDPVLPIVEISGEITPKPVEIILTGKDKVYDGDASLDTYELTYNQGDMVEGDEIKVKTTGAFHPWYGEMTNEMKDIGEYYVWASAGYYLEGVAETNGDNYSAKDDPVRSKEKYFIAPALIIVEPCFQSKIEGSNDPALTYTVWQDHGADEGEQYIEGLYEGDTLSGTLTRTPGESSGKYDVFIGTLKNLNYVIDFRNGQNMFEISQKALIQKTVSTPSEPMAAESSTLSDAKEDAPESSLLSKLLFTIITGAGGFFFMKMRQI